MGCAFCFFMASIMFLNSISFSLDTSPSSALVSAVVVLKSAGSVVVVAVVVVNVVGIVEVGTVTVSTGLVIGAAVVAAGDPLVDMLQIVQQKVNAKCTTSWHK